MGVTTCRRIDEHRGKLEFKCSLKSTAVKGKLYPVKMSETGSPC